MLLSKKVNFMNNVIRGILKGLIVSYVITVTVFCFFSMVYSVSNAKDYFLYLIVRVTVIVSIAIGAIVSCSDINSKGFINGSIIGILYTVTMFALGIFLEEATNFKLELVLVNIIIGLFFGIVGVNKKRKRNN